MSLTWVTEWVKACRAGEMWGSWRVLGTKEGLRGWHLPALAEGTQGRGTRAPDGYGVQCGHGGLGAQQGSLALHTFGTGFHETDGDG